MHHLRSRTIAALLGLVVSALAAVSTVGAQDQKLSQEEIEKIVRDYLLREPEVLAEAFKRLQQRQSASAAIRSKQAIHDHRQALFADQASPVEGNAQGKVTIVEFFDYRCVHCRSVASTIDQILNSNKSVRVVYKNFPVLGEPSVLAARAAVAAQQQGGWPKLHRAMLAFSGDFTLDALLALASSVGLDSAKLKTDMMSSETDRALQANLTLAAALGLDATPSFVIGDRVIRGALSADAFQTLVDEEAGKR